MQYSQEDLRNIDYSIDNAYKHLKVLEQVRDTFSKKVFGIVQYELPLNECFNKDL